MIYECQNIFVAFISCLFNSSHLSLPDSLIMSITLKSPFAFSGDLVGNIQSVSAEHGHAVGISFAVILVVTGAICLGAFLLFRRHRKKRHSGAGMQANEEERVQMELETDSTRAGSNKIFSSTLVSNRPNPQRLDVRRVRCTFAVKIIVIVISEFLERHSKAKRTRAPAYSRT